MLLNPSHIEREGNECIDKIDKGTLNLPTVTTTSSEEKAKLFL